MFSCSFEGRRRPAGFWPSSRTQRSRRFFVVACKRANVRRGVTRETYPLRAWTLTKPGSSVNDGVQDRSEMWPIGILRADKLLGRSEQKIRIAELLHHEERLCIA